MPGTSSHSRRRARGSRHGSRVGSSSGGDRHTPGAEALSSRSSAELVQDAQDAATELKTLLNTQLPGSNEVEAVRQRARNALLTVLFQHPLSPHAQSIDTLWFSTTYSLISEYREVVARIEAALPPSGSRRNGPKSGGGDAVGDLRRTLSRFSSLLAAEDTFYRSLVTRLVAFYRLQDYVRDHVSLVGISVPTDATEDDPSLAPPLSREEVEKKLSMVYKALVYLGDLERYKEQYSDKARREAREGALPRDSERYSRAILFYEVARGLQPDNGTAFNQLAVIDGYMGDNFHCTYHYFRALAVRQPFPSGRANLERVFKKTFDRWRNQRHAGAGAEDKDEGTADDPDAFKRHLLTILSIHFLRAGTTHLSQLRPVFLDLFSRLLSARQLPSETIVKTTAMVIGSHWYARFDQSPGQPQPEDANGAAQLSERQRIVEESSLIFLLTTFTTLVTVSTAEAEDVLKNCEALDDSALATDDDPEEDGEQDGTLALAQRISAVVRRILPALRIASRWLKSHLEYLSRAAQTRNPDLVDAIASFWSSYKRLMLALARAFPLVQLPSLVEPLEEDLDMRGFLPLRRSLTDHGLAEEVNINESSGHDVHPNEEQLMRISDLLVDVKLLMQTEYGSIALNTGTPLPSAPFVAGPATDEAASISVSTETEDDPVNLAMRATLAEGSSIGDDMQGCDDEEEVILWGRSTPVVHDAPQLPNVQTAQDLMQSLTFAPAPSQPPANPPHLLFGGDIAGTGSIWTMSREESQQGAQRSATKPGAPNIATLWNDGPGHHHSPGSNPSPWSPASAGAPGQQHQLHNFQQPILHQPRPHMTQQHHSQFGHHQPTYQQHHNQPQPNRPHQVPPHVPPQAPPSNWYPSPQAQTMGASRQSPSSIWPGGNTWGPPATAPRPVGGSTWSQTYPAP